MQRGRIDIAFLFRFGEGRCVVMGEFVRFEQNGAVSNLLLSSFFFSFFLFFFFSSLFSFPTLPSSSSLFLSLTLHHKVGEVVLCRPNELNTMGDQFFVDYQKAMDEADANEDVRVIIVRAEGYILSTRKSKENRLSSLLLFLFYRENVLCWFGLEIQQLDGGS